MAGHVLQTHMMEMLARDPVLVRGQPAPRDKPRPEVVEEPPEEQGILLPEPPTSPPLEEQGELPRDTPDSPPLEEQGALLPEPSSSPTLAEQGRSPPRYATITASEEQGEIPRDTPDLPPLEEQSCLPLSSPVAPQQLELHSPSRPTDVESPANTSWDPCLPAHSQSPASPEYMDEFADSPGEVFEGSDDSDHRANTDSGNSTENETGDDTEPQSEPLLTETPSTRSTRSTDRQDLNAMCRELCELRCHLPVQLTRTAAPHSQLRPVSTAALHQ
ncbi:uncharacterized protein LOC107044380 [Diachasma alloeum]|uniref:uncharacterized protein LOC107044380 n=1 Tax=Diachasma alloeum TaxID=454923 RepID=UPI0007383FA7|nr:uncharacterized protein LOC107044380 [Diachasma alloeum]